MEADGLYLNWAIVSMAIRKQLNILLLKQAFKHHFIAWKGMHLEKKW